MIKIGAQLYTVRELLNSEEDIRNTLREIKDIGYDCVQLFGSAKLAERCAFCASEAGIETSGILVDLDTCLTDEAALMDICKTYKIKELGVSTGFAECIDTKRYIHRLNDFAAKAVDAGLFFSYHNHAHEFIRLADGKTAMEHFLTGFDPRSVGFMPDTYWLQDGGYDVRYFLEQTKSRVKTLHLKDYKRTEDGHTFAEVGCGNLYWEGIIKTALDCGIYQFIVEQYKKLM